MPDSPIMVVCLCANWCGTCRDYQPLFEQLQPEFPASQLVWIDIEDHADLLDPVEVDNFPTLLIASHEDAGFFGPVTPHLETLRRLIRNHQGEPNAPFPPPVAALARRIRAHLTQHSTTE